MNFILLTQTHVCLCLVKNFTFNSSFEPVSMKKTIFRLSEKSFSTFAPQFKVFQEELQSSAAPPNED